MKPFYVNKKIKDLEIEEESISNDMRISYAHKDYKVTRCPCEWYDLLREARPIRKKISLLYNEKSRLHRRFEKRCKTKVK